VINSRLEKVSIVQIIEHLIKPGLDGLRKR